MAAIQQRTNFGKSGDLITVGCKLPHGIHMDFRKAGAPLQRVTLKGSNAANVIGGYGITEGVSREYFDAWMEQHKEHPAVKAGLIFAHKETASVQSETRNRAKLINGLEPIDPKNPAKGIKPLAASDPGEED